MLLHVALILGRFWFGAPNAAKPLPPAQLDGLEITVSAAAKQSLAKAKFDITLTNRSQKPITIMSHVASDRNHYDWNDLEFGTADSNWIHLSLVGARDKSAPVTKTLAPGASLTHTIVLAEWNHGSAKPIVAGTYMLRARYFAHQSDAPSKTTIWTGTLRSEPISIQLR